MDDDKKNIRGDFTAGYKRVSANEDTMEIPNLRSSAPKRPPTPESKKTVNRSKKEPPKMKNRRPAAQADKRRPTQQRSSAQTRQKNAASPQRQQRPSPTSGTSQKSSAEKRREHAEMRRREARRKQIRSYLLLGVIAVIVCVVLSLTVFFKISSITVEGELNAYTAERIIAECGIKKGENLFMCDADGCESQLPEKMPYLGSVTVKRKLPDKIILIIEETAADYSFITNGKAVMMSADGKILEIGDSEIAINATVVIGAAPESPVVGETAEFAEARVPELLKKIGDSAAAAGITSLTSCDISNMSYIKLSYQGRITIILGSSNGMEKKMLLAARVIDKENKIDVNQLGQIDLTVEGKAYFRHLKADVEEVEFSEPNENAQTPEQASASDIQG